MDTPHYPADAPDRHARTLLPAVVHDRLRHLSLDLGRSLADLLVDGALLLLRFHDRGTDLPEPQPPIRKEGSK